MRNFNDKIAFYYIDGETWEVATAFRVYLGENKWIDIPEGFITNFASMPKACRLFFDNLDPRIAKPAVVHDALVGEFSKQICIQTPHGKYIPDWDESAEILEDLMKRSKCAQWLRNLAKYLVKCHGIIRSL